MTDTIHVRSLNAYLRQRFGEKVYKLALDGGFTCPTRDGTLDTRGCIFCAGGSGAFTVPVGKDVHAAIEQAKTLVADKGGKKYITYYQSYTGTYAPLERLRALYTETLSHPDVVALSIGTRPDCLPDEVVELLRELNAVKPVWVELGLQTLHEATMTVEGDLACCIGEIKKTHENIEKRRAFTVALVNRELLAAVDYFGSASGYRQADKFERTGIKAVRSAHVDAPIIEGCPLVFEWKLKELVRMENFSTVIGTIVDVAADESVLGETGRADAEKLGMVLYDFFSNSYFTLGEKVGKAWGEGKKFLK